jgi:RNA polymerase sigma-70 factor (ECF subfamily)
MGIDSPRSSARLQLTPLSPEATSELVDRFKQGDNGALDVLLARCLPPLQRWARGRLPPFARGMMDTSDLVQDTVVSALRRLEFIEMPHQGALQAYLRQGVVNRIRDVIRQRRRRPVQTDMPEQLADEETSPLERLIGAEQVARYDAAILRLSASDRAAIVGRFELQYDYEELTLVLDKPSVNATRVAVMRAVRRLVDEIRHGG